MMDAELRVVSATLEDTVAERDAARRMVSQLERRAAELTELNIDSIRDSRNQSSPSKFC